MGFYRPERRYGNPAALSELSRRFCGGPGCCPGGREVGLRRHDRTRGDRAPVRRGLRGSRRGRLPTPRVLRGSPPRRDRPSTEPEVGIRRDRKSTRLNSSHLVISYAVFCLKKKKKTIAR